MWREVSSVSGTSLWTLPGKHLSSLLQAGMFFVCGLCNTQELIYCSHYLLHIATAASNSYPARQHALWAVPSHLHTARQ